MCQGFRLSYRLDGLTAVAPQQGLAKAPGTIDKAIAEAATIAQKIAIHLTVVAIDHTPQQAVALAGNGITAQATVHTDRRCRLEIPFAGVVLCQSFVGEHAGWAYLHQVAAEFVLQHAILVTPEIDVVV